jgi:hypothetical protein
VQNKEQKTNQEVNQILSDFNERKRKYEESVYNMPYQFQFPMQVMPHFTPSLNTHMLNSAASYTPVVNTPVVNTPAQNDLRKVLQNKKNKRRK